MVSGESHYLWGRRYRLNFNETTGRNEVKVQGSNKLMLCIKPDTPIEKKAALLSSFYRAELKARTEAILSSWLPVIGVSPSDWGIRKMKTKWGSCNTASKRISLNLELAKNRQNVWNTFWFMNSFICLNGIITNASVAIWINSCPIGGKDETC